MSYILDALRRADAERDRGTVPGIHAQPGYGGPVPAGMAPPTKPWPWLAAGAAAVLLMGGLAWYLLAPAGRGAVDPAPPATVPVAVAPPPAAIAPSPVATPAPVAAPARVQLEASTPVRKPKPPTAPASALDAKPAATAEKVYALSELPEDIRRQLPNLVVGGSMYSSKPADRLLILNGQVAHEGDKIGNDLILQQIRLKGALLNFKGYRYAISF